MNQIESRPFGDLTDGRTVQLYTLTNANGMKVSITNYGGIITEVIVPDKKGNMGDVVLGYDNLSGYLEVTPYFGALIGRYGNRIARGKFMLNNQEYPLATNNGPNHLHGGVQGFDKLLWTAKEIESGDNVGLELSYVSKDGEEGYPGTLTVKVNYILTNQNEIRFEYEATTDKPTICNLTNHSYFNLKDAGKTPILGHILMIDADKMTPVNETLIPTGELTPVQDTPFDFRNPKVIGRRINEDTEQIKFGQGYDHNFVLNGTTGELRKVAVLSESESGRVLEVFTEEPGVQFYSGNFLDGTITGKNGTVYAYRHGLCLETQHFPDSPNKPDFPTTTLNPGEVYKTTTVYKFLVAQ
jgi:aldose 1-epimerase